MNVRVYLLASEPTALRVALLRDGAELFQTLHLRQNGNPDDFVREIRDFADAVENDVAQLRRLA